MIDIINSFAPDKKIYLNYNTNKVLPKDILIYSLDYKNQSGPMKNINPKILVVRNQSNWQNWQSNSSEFLTLIDCTFPALIGVNSNA